MAERKSGPVKPPVIDLKAREASGEQAEQGAAAPKRPARNRSARRSAPSTGAAPDKAAEAGATDDEAGAATTQDRAERVADKKPEAPSKPSNTDEAARTEAPRGGPSAPETPVPPPPPPRPPARLAMPWSAISIAAVAGAVIGAGLTYLLANWIALPVQSPPFADPAPALSTLSETDAALETRLAAAEETARNAEAALEASQAEFDALAAELRQSVADVEAAIPEAPAPVDVSAIEEQLQNLDARVTAIAAGASSDDAAALATSLGNIEQTLADLTAQLETVDRRVTAADGDLTSLRTDLDEARSAIAAQTRSLAGADVGPAIRLPLIVSGLEAAFATGRGYDAELASLRALLPDLAVPESVSERAASGLPRPDAVLARFEERLPAILSGRTAQSTGDFTQDAIEWAKALLALRPAEEMEGSTPEAVVSRLEGAVERRDFGAAAALLAQLPPAMREAAGDVGTDIVALAAADTFVANLRAQALTPAEPAN